MFDFTVDGNAIREFGEEFGVFQGEEQAFHVVVGTKGIEMFEGIVFHLVGVIEAFFAGFPVFVFDVAKGINGDVNFILVGLFECGENDGGTASCTESDFAGQTLHILN